MAQLITEIGKIYNNRLNSGISPSQACVFNNDEFSKDFPNFKLEQIRNELEDLSKRGLINLWIYGSFVLTDLGIEYVK